MPIITLTDSGGTGTFVNPFLDWSSSINTVTNEATITAVFKAYTTGTQNTFGTFSGTINIGGNVKTLSARSLTIVTGGSGVVTTIDSHSATFGLNSNGSGSWTLSATGGMPGTSWTATSGSGTASVDYDRSPSWTDASVSSSATRGTFYSDSVSATNMGTYSLLEGSFPPGLSLSGGTLSGTPTTVGAWSFRIRATGAYEGYTDTGWLSITVSPALPVFSDSTVASSANVGIAYSDAVAASEAESYSIRNSANTGAGTLPPGLSLSVSSGTYKTATITGTPTTPGTYSFRIRATNGTGSTDTAILTITAISAVRVWIPRTAPEVSGFVPGLVNVWTTGVNPGDPNRFVSGTIKVWDGTTWKNTN